MKCFFNQDKTEMELVLNTENPQLNSRIFYIQILINIWELHLQVMQTGIHKYCQTTECSLKFKIQIFFSEAIFYIRTIFEYAHEVWHNCGVYILLKVNCNLKSKESLLLDHYLLQP